MKVSRLPAALAYKLIRRGCSLADLATLAMLWPRGGHVPQQTKAGRAIKPGQGASNLAPPLCYVSVTRMMLLRAVTFSSLTSSN
jgi:hypothetical protein